MKSKSLTGNYLMKRSRFFTTLVGIALTPIAATSIIAKIQDVKYTIGIIPAIRKYTVSTPSPTLLALLVRKLWEASLFYWMKIIS